MASMMAIIEIMNCLRGGNWDENLVIQNESRLGMGHISYASPLLDIGTIYNSERFQSHFANLLGAKLLSLGYHASLPRNQLLKRT